MKRLLISVVLLLLSSPVLANRGFTDSALADWLARKPTGLIYVWSPQMPLSELGRAEVLEIAASSGFEVLTLVDPYSVQSDTGADAPVAALELLRLGVLDHFPALLVVRRGEILPGVLHGYEEPSSLKHLVLKKLSHL